MNQRGVHWTGKLMEARWIRLWGPPKAVDRRKRTADLGARGVFVARVQAIQDSCRRILLVKLSVRPLFFRQCRRRGPLPYIEVHVGHRSNAPNLAGHTGAFTTATAGLCERWAVQRMTHTTKSRWAKEIAVPNGGIGCPAGATYRPESYLPTAIARGCRYRVHEKYIHTCALGEREVAPPMFERKRLDRFIIHAEFDEAHEKQGR